MSDVQKKGTFQDETTNALKVLEGNLRPFLEQVHEEQAAFDRLQKAITEAEGSIAAAETEAAQLRMDAASAISAGKDARDITWLRSEKLASVQVHRDLIEDLRKVHIPAQAQKLKAARKVVAGKLAHGLMEMRASFQGKHVMPAEQQLNDMLDVYRAIVDEFFIKHEELFCDGVTMPDYRPRRTMAP
jgi:hypothetical protein